MYILQIVYMVVTCFWLGLVPHQRLRQWLYEKVRRLIGWFVMYWLVLCCLYGDILVAFLICWLTGDMCIYWLVDILVGWLVGWLLF